MQVAKGGLLGDHKSTPVKHKHMLFPPACGRRTGIQTVTPQLRTVFPGTPARFFARPSWSTPALSRGGPVAPSTFNVVQFVIVSWRELNSVKTPQVR
jgi:hypothetical protein